MAKVFKKYSPSGPGGTYTQTGWISLAGLTNPESIAVDDASNVYVGTLQGTVKFAYDSGADSYAAALALSATPTLSLAVTGDGATIFQSDTSFHLSTVNGGATTAFGSDQGIPLSLDSGGNLYTIGAGGTMLQEYVNTSGTFSTTPTDIASVPQDIDSPISIAFAQTSVVPEPSTWALLLAGFVFLFSLHRRFVRSELKK